MSGIYSRPAPAEEEGWRASFAPYLWLSGIDGRAATLPGLPPVEVDKSFSEIAEELDSGFIFAGEVRKGRFGFLGDIVYSSVSSEEIAPNSLRTSLGTDTLSLTAAGTYQLVDGDGSSFGVLAGARLWSVDTELAVNLQGQSLLDLKEKETWVDPVVGFSGRARLGERFFVVGGGTVGAGSSDLTWNLWSTVGYSFNESLGLGLGYRALSVDYDRKDYLLDVTQHGFLVGLVVQIGATGL
jgi:hypothetical protein